MTFETVEPHDGIAIVGMSGRFPGAANIDAFWQNLCDGVESIRRFSQEELLAAGVAPEVLAQPQYVRARPVLEGVEMFDAGFFGYTPREAELIDPQQRLFLECAWEALEHAGHDVQQYPGWIGVYGGVGAPVYAITNLGANPDMAVAIANSADYVATRVSYKLDLSGPSFTVQAACATSLLAVHTACQGLLDHQCDMALAGGASIDLPQASGYGFEPGGIRSPDGRVRTFDADARGTVFGNGVGVVALKRLADALADGNTIHAVIRGSATNNDGAAKAGYTAPSVEGQARVIALAQRRAEVEPDSIGYVEAHGTGTELGDPIEVAALTKAFRARTQQKQFCAIGSVKPNIGHVDTAAGVAGLIKTALALHHGRIPPTLNFQRPNPKIDFANSPFYVNTSLSDWPARAGTPRRAALSSFGIGGTNVHAILEEAPAAAPADPAAPWQLLTVSARSAAALDAATRSLAEHLRRHPALPLADVAFTLQAGRRRWPHRRTVLCRGVQDAAEALQALDPARVHSAQEDRTERPVAFLFPGQGAQHLRMGWDLYQIEPSFRQHVDQCAALLHPLLDLDLRTLIFPLENSPSDAQDLLNQTRFAQPALFMIEYALAQCWMAWGVQPHAMIGHSIGEYAAACLAGVFSLEDALTLVTARGRLMQQMPLGAMLAVALPESAVLPLLDDGLTLAAVNAPARCTVAGPEHAVARLERTLAQREVSARRLHTSHAFHSEMMEPALGPFLREVQRVRLAPPRIPCLSNLTGTWLTAEQATSAHYWAQQLRGTVRFKDGVDELLRTPDTVLLEVGPGNTLVSLVRQSDATAIASLPHAQDSADAGAASMLSGLGQLWLAGVKIDWARVHAGQRRRRLPLPTYPFERQRYWVDLGGDAVAKPPQPPAGKKADLGDWFYLPVWRRSLPPAGVAVPSRWLVFTDACGLGAAVVEQLRQSRHGVICVSAGEAFAQHDRQTFTIDAGRPQDYTALLAALSEAQAWPQAVLHLWSVTPAHERDFQSAQRLGFNSLLHLAQAMGQQGTVEPIRMQVVSNGMQQVAPGELCQPEKATLLGPCRTMPQEYPHIACQSVDVLLPADKAALRELARSLIDECSAPASQDALAYRGRQRWVQAFEPIRIDAGARASPRLREQGVYLITGGLGAIGLVMAQTLARSGQAKLVLLGRSDLPAREHWSEWLAAHGEDEPTSRKLRHLQALETLGSEVMVLSADVTDERQMRRAVDVILTRFGALHGVLHSAGIAGGGLMQLKTLEQAQKVFAPKVRAMQVLEAVLTGHRLDFMVLCSSTLSFMGEVGQADYCAANAFLDAYAHHNTSRGVPTLSINWEGWLQAGMAAQALEKMGTTTLDHRLFSHSVKEASGTSYVFKLGASHWLFAEHRIRGLPTLPGTAHIEMARAACLCHLDAAEVELRDVYFLAPLMVHPGELREIKITLQPGADGQTEFRVLSRSDLRPAWQAYSRGTLRRAAPQAAPVRDLASIRAQCSQGEVGARELSMQAMNDGQDYWGPRWQSFTRVLLGPRQALALLELPAQFQDDTQEFVLHPALLDVATAVGLPGVISAADAYLPLSYDRIVVHAGLPPRLYAHVRSYPEAQAGQDMMSFDVTLLDEQGRVLVDITRFTLRRVGEAVAMHEAEPPAAPAVLQKGILLHEGAEAFRRLLSHDLFPQVVVNSTDLRNAIDSARRGASDTTLLESVAGRSGPAHARPALKTAYVAPSTAVERQLAGIWQDVLGLQQVGLHDDYFELGGDSLSALLIISRMRSALHVDLAPHQFFERPTIAGLAMQAAGAGEAACGPELLVLLQAAAGGRPLFCVHPVGGSVHFYQELARHLGAQGPVYGIQSAEEARLPLPADLAAMSETYVQAIRTVQPQGPYRLLGWSTGGLVAMAVAAAFEARGETVDYVGLLDSRPVEDFSTEERLFIASTSVILSSVRGASFDAQEIQSVILQDPQVDTLYQADPATVLPYLLQKTGAGLGEEALASLRLQHETTHRHMALLSGFLPPRLQAPLHIGWATEPAGRPTWDWARFSTSRSTCHEVGANHYTMLQGTHAQEIAGNIRALSGPVPA